jgi:hypothetical protein
LSCLNLNVNEKIVEQGTKIAEIDIELSKSRGNVGGGDIRRCMPLPDPYRLMELTGKKVEQSV